MLQVQGLLAQINTYRKRAGVYFFVPVLLVLIPVCAIAGHSIVYAQLNDWKLVPRPERLTELYFTDHRLLGDVYAPGQQQTVAFTVHNLEHRGTGYSYTITQDSEEPKTIAQLAAGSFRLGHGETRRVSVPVTFVEQGAGSRITVHLVYDGIAFGDDDASTQQQEIYYRTTRYGAAR